MYGYQWNVGGYGAQPPVQHQQSNSQFFGATEQWPTYPVAVPAYSPVPATSFQPAAFTQIDDQRPLPLDFAEPNDLDAQQFGDFDFSTINEEPEDWTNFGEFFENDFGLDLESPGLPFCSPSLISDPSRPDSMQSYNSALPFNSNSASPSMVSRIPTPQPYIPSYPQTQNRFPDYSVDSMFAALQHEESASNAKASAVDLRPDEIRQNRELSLRQPADIHSADSIFRSIVNEEKRFLGTETATDLNPNEGVIDVGSDPPLFSGDDLPLRNPDVTVELPNWVPLEGFEVTFDGAIVKIGEDLYPQLVAECRKCGDLFYALCADDFRNHTEASCRNVTNESTESAEDEDDELEVAASESPEPLPATYSIDASPIKEPARQTPKPSAATSIPSADKPNAEPADSNADKVQKMPEWIPAEIFNFSYGGTYATRRYRYPYYNAECRVCGKSLKIRSASGVKLHLKSQQHCQAVEDRLSESPEAESVSTTTESVPAMATDPCDSTHLLFLMIVKRRRGRVYEWTDPQHQKKIDQMEPYVPPPAPPTNVVLKETTNVPTSESVNTTATQKRKHSSVDVVSVGATTSPENIPPKRRCTKLRNLRPEDDVIVID